MGKEVKERKKVWMRTQLNKVPSSFDSRVGKLTSPKGGKKALVWKRAQTVCQRRQRRYGVPGLLRRETRYQVSQPVLETKSMKRSGRAIQVPKRVSPSRGQSRASTWRVDAMKKRSKKQGESFASSRFTERDVAHEELRRREGSERGSKAKIHSEWRAQRSRIHKAAKANRVNRRK